MLPTDKPSSDSREIPEDLPDDPGESYRGKALRCPPVERDSDLEETQPRATAPVRHEEPIPEPVRIHHRYTLSQLLGVGAQGEVWQATQEALKRTVAIKRLRSAENAENGGVEAELARLEHFRQEALVAASLEHPNIIPVHDLVTDIEGRPVLVMKEVRGKPWVEILERSVAEDDPDFLGRHIPVLMAVAQAVAFAHSRGVIHRDLKPSQVMIGEFGEVLLTDWGLAMAASSPEADSSHLIRHGIWGYLVNPAGTPAYMAPEQARAGLEGLGPWTDVFLLGGMLYYLLTGSPPYVANHSRAALLMARKCSIDPPEERAPERLIPAELSRLAMKALDPEPSHRVGSAVEFHQALQDYLSGAGHRRESLAITEVVEKRCREMAGYAELAQCQAELARAEGLWSGNPHLRGLRHELTTRFAQLALTNNDLVLAEIQGAMLGSDQQGRQVLERVDWLRKRQKKSSRERQLALRGLGLFLVLFLATFGQYIRVEVRARDEAEGHRLRTESARKAADAARAAAEEARAQAVAERNATRRELYYSGIGFTDASLREGRADKALDMLLNGLPQELRQLEWGHLLSRITQDDMILQRTSTTSETIFRAEFSPDGRRIVSSQRNGTVSVWDAESGRQLYSKKTELEKLWFCRFSPDGQSILLTSFEGEGRILNAETGEIRARLRYSDEKPGIMRGGDFSPDGRRAAVAVSDKTIRMFDTATGQLLSTFQLPEIPYDLAFTPDGAHLAVNLVAGGRAVLCDSGTGEIVRGFLGHEDVGYSVTVSPDGQRVATTCRDRRIRIFDVRTGENIRTFYWPENRSNSAVFSPDGKVLAVATEGGTCLFYDIRSTQLLGRAEAAPEMYAVSFEPSGRKVLTSSFSEVRLWSLDRVLNAPLPEVKSLPLGVTPERVRQVSFPLDREILWFGRDEAWMSSAPAVLFSGDSGSYAVEPFGTLTSPDESLRIELGYKPQAPRVVDAGGSEVLTLETEGNVFNACFSRSGRLAATGSYTGVAQIWDTATWKPLGVCRAGAGVVWSLEFSPDEKQLAIGCDNGDLLLWDVPAAQVVHRMTAHKKERAIVMVRFSPDGTKLVTSSNDRTAKIWDCAKGEEIVMLTGHAKALMSGVFSPDGQRVMTASFDGTAKLWDASTGRELLTLFTARGGRYLMTCGFSRDGRRVFFTTDKRELFEAEILPWQEEELPGAADLSFDLRLELWKRLRRLNPECRVEDIAWGSN